MNNYVDQVYLAGTIASEPTFCYKEQGIAFYSMRLLSERNSGILDTLLLIIDEKRIESDSSYTGRHVNVSGEYRSYNKWITIDGKRKSKLILYVFVKEITEASEDLKHDINNIRLTGYVCKKTILRKTPVTNKDITDILLAVDTPDGSAYYIPCICWNCNAVYASRLKIGDKVKIWGRIQSREYEKKIGPEKIEIRIAYEVSVSKIIGYK